MNLKGNPYFNTIWSNRDQEFYWSGVKHGALIAGIIVPSAIVCIYEIIQEFKEL